MSLYLQWLTILNADWELSPINSPNSSKVGDVNPGGLVIGYRSLFACIAMVALSYPFHQNIQRILLSHVIDKSHTRIYKDYFYPMSMTNHTPALFSQAKIQNIILDYCLMDILLSRTLQRCPTHLSLCLLTFLDVM